MAAEAVNLESRSVAFVLTFMFFPSKSMGHL